MLEHDREKNTTYAESLLAYLDAFGDTAGAAKALCVHENTLRYRIEPCPAQEAKLSEFTPRLKQLIGSIDPNVPERMDAIAPNALLLLNGAVITIGGRPKEDELTGLVTLQRDPIYVGAERLKR